MPQGNDKAAIQAKRASLSKGNPGITTESKWVATADNSEGQIYRGAGMLDQKALENALQNLKRTLKGGVANVNQLAIETYDDSASVLQAIKEGKLKKVDAIAYAEKFNLITADKMDSITPIAAIQMLENDVAEDNVLNTIAQVVKPGDTYVNDGDKTVLQEKPDAVESPVNVIDVNGKPTAGTGEKASDVNDAKQEDMTGNVKPDGKVTQDSLMSHPVPNDSNVNTAKPEESFPEPNKLKAKSDMNSSTVNKAKPEDVKPDAVESPVNTIVHNNKPTAGTGEKASTVNTSKTEDHSPKPTKAQIIPPMDMPKDTMAPMPPMDMKDHKKEEKNPLEQVEDALEMLSKFKHILETVEDRLEGTYEKPVKKEKKPKEDKEKSDKPEDKKLDTIEKKEDKIEDMDKKELKDDKKDKAPELPKEAPAIMASKEVDSGEFPKLGYKVELIKDSKSPIDSYYVVSYDNKPAFSVSAKQALAKIEKAPDTLTVAEFLSEDYSKELVKELNAQGALTVFKNVYASRAIVLADAQDLLPDGKTPEPQAKDMAVSAPVDQALNNDPTQKESYADMVLDIAADSLAMSKGASAQEFTEQMKSIFSDEAKTKEFQGRLSEKIDHKKVDMDTVNSPETPGIPAPEEIKAMKVALETFKALMPEVKAAIKERDELKAKVTQINQDNILKARTSKTLEVAEKKASCGLIDSDDIKTEAVRLAKLSNEELGLEIKNFENSLKIANKIKEKVDYNKIEDNRKPVVANVLASIPNQQTEEFESPKSSLPWSSGIRK